MRISLVQFSSGVDVDDNASRAARRVTEAADAGADLVVFPEATMASFAAGRLDVVAQSAERFAAAMAAAARSAGVVVIAGMFLPADAVGGKNRIDNVAAVFYPDGRRETYAKMHCYDAFGYRESATVRPGTNLVTCEVAGTTVGLAVCFDIRFPEQFVKLAARGAELIVVPASWSAGPGKTEQWELLARARALDSTSVVAAVDQALPEGSDPEEPTGPPLGVGHSLVVGPDGQIVACAGRGEGLLTVDVDLEAVARVRRAIPVVALRGSEPLVEE
ncbi:amidohydrolase [Corynebacterium sp. 13CS0277]|uniref:nitrilase-related carbon-nitrogen hydrolase n=1 Tax=Corynebacterium sp. 13CS0277 TaxID=2071994 RepID=UPI000D024FF8|nr:nitrilase-related carbon-nitrogen hydrolase [Corynebacterium sp. 13CS0277]PRQ11809.1 amidohydrolase [Corynebacterium sp. 13CS0277]